MPPPTLRITRPYSSEAEFVDGDFAWIGRTTIVLPDVEARTAGELVRFEIILRQGAPVFRGEGHVVGYHASESGRPPGLEIRFTRIDARSKLIVDKVRDRRAALPRQNVAIAVAADPGAAESKAEPAVVSAEVQPLVLKLSLDAPSERTSPPQKGGPRKIAPPANRDEILERLRARAKQLAAAGGLSFKKR
ncbi:MAG TPA: hypothetical protein VF881_06620 [Polyangiaceae bacterium]